MTTIRPNRNRDWAHHAAEYSASIAPYATPLFELSQKLFTAISDCRNRLKVEENVNNLINNK